MIWLRPESKTALMILCAVGWAPEKTIPQGSFILPPNVDAQNIFLFNRAFDTLEMFQRNGALPDTVVRGFGRQWEQAFSEAPFPGS